MNKQLKTKEKSMTIEEAKGWLKAIKPQLVHQKELIDKGSATPELERKHLEDLKRYVEAIAIIFPEYTKNIKIPWKKVSKSKEALRKFK